MKTSSQEKVEVPPSDQIDVYKIYIRSDLYVPVDKNGYVIGPCAEGSLGSVVQALGPDKPFALKIPRLLADTVRENAYIVDLTEHELKNVLKVGHSDGLIVAHDLERQGLKLRRSGLADLVGNAEAQRQEGGAILVAFEKEKNPRFCNVKFDQIPSVHPPDALKQVQQPLTPEVWARLAAAQEDVYAKFARPVYWSTEEDDNVPASIVRTDGDGSEEKWSVKAGVLEKTASAKMHATTWYAAIPAILYDWATGSLQQAIGKAHLKTWHFSQHFALFERILKGVNALHDLGMLHADIRPANIMSTQQPRENGEVVLDDPEKFGLADYGSFGSQGSQERMGVDGGGESGNTMLGPGVGAQRVTPFYSRERRTGVERESADTAIIVKLPNTTPVEGESDEYFIRLGWRTQLLEPNSNRVEGKVLADMPIERKRLEKDDEALRILSSEGLQAGDRLRLREYVFEVIQAGQLDNDLICRVRGRFARVIHDRLAVFDPEGVIKDPVLSLSNYVELRQWSAATDLYSVGAICLYTLFCTGIQTHSLPASKEVTARAVDSLFGDLINVLESVPHFRIFWAQLELFRGEFEWYLKNHPNSSPDQIANHKGPNDKTLVQMATDATNQICQSAPHVKVILQQFGMNLVHFNLFMHFIMSCLHRQTHLESDGGGKAQAESTPRYQPHSPFAKSRIDPAAKNGIAKKALDRLKQLKQYHALSEATLKPFVPSSDTIPEFNPKPNVELLEELSRAKQAASTARRDLDVAAQKTRDLMNRWKGKIQEKHFVIGKGKVTQLIEEVIELQK